MLGRVLEAAIAWAMVVLLLSVLCRLFGYGLEFEPRVSAQAPRPTEYSLRRLTVWDATLSPPYREGWQVFEVIPASAVSCNRPHRLAYERGFRIADPALPHRDCVWFAPAGLEIFRTTEGATYRFTLAVRYGPLRPWSRAVPFLDIRVR